LPSLRRRSLLTEEKVMTKYLLAKKAKANEPAADAAAVTDGKVELPACPQSPPHLF